MRQSESMGKHGTWRHIWRMVLKTAIFVSVSLAIGAATWTTGFFYTGEERTPELGQSREQAEQVLGEAAFFGRTCFGELAVFTDREQDGVEKHVMAILDEQSGLVKATETQTAPVNVTDATACSRLVVETAQSSFPASRWSDAEPGHYSAGVSQRYFLKASGPGNTSREIWGDYVGSAGKPKTCEIFVREALQGEERLAASGEWTLPGARKAVAFDLNASFSAPADPGS